MVRLEYSVEFENGVPGVGVILGQGTDPGRVELNMVAVDICQITLLVVPH